MLVVATAGATRFGGIAAALAGNEQPSAFERGIHRLGMLIMRLTIFLTLFVLLTHLAFGRPAIESFLFAAALAVGLTPELLPMVMTVSLSRGALRMAKRKVIVKRLASIHDLGAMDVLCTDKTGTLTEAKISLLARIGPDGHDCPRVLALAGINSRFESGIRSPLDTAILEQCAERVAGRLDENRRSSLRFRATSRLRAGREGWGAHPDHQGRSRDRIGARDHVRLRRRPRAALDAGTARREVERVQDRSRRAATGCWPLPGRRCRKLRASAPGRRVRSGIRRFLCLCRSAQGERGKRRGAARSRRCPGQGRFRRS